METTVSTPKLRGIKSYYDHIDPAAIISIRLAADKNNDPCVQVFSFDRINDTLITHSFPLTRGWHVHIVNEFLRSLDTDFIVEFKGYAQYNELLENITHSLLTR